MRLADDQRQATAPGGEQMTEQRQSAKDAPKSPRPKASESAAGETTESFADEPLADPRADPAWEAPIGRPIEDVAPEASRGRSQTSESEKDTSERTSAAGPPGTRE
jgi:hypothetical protein